MDRNEIDKIFGNAATNSNLRIMKAFWSLQNVKNYLANVNCEADAKEIYDWLQNFEKETPKEN